jgi:hypothetical protein
VKAVPCGWTNWTSKPTLPSDVIRRLFPLQDRWGTMKSAIGAALIAAATLLGGAAITTGSTEPASAAVENSRATMATDFSARRRYRRVARYAPRYYRQRYAEERYYPLPAYSVASARPRGRTRNAGRRLSPAYSSYGWHSGLRHDWHSGAYYYGPHRGEYHDWHGDTDADD